MKKLTSQLVGAGLITSIFIIGFVSLLYGISWIATCGIIKLITMCFGWNFSWAIATGVWLVICIAKGIFSHNTTVHTK